jgi:hypothetical protein
LKKSNDCPERKNMGSLPVLGGGFLNNWIWWFFDSENFKNQIKHGYLKNPIPVWH